MACLGFARGAAGDHPGARKILSALEPANAGGATSAYYPALVWLGLGEHNEALTRLEAVEQERPADSVFSAWLKPEPIWDPLRQAPASKPSSAV